jgi:biofilm PGA synthesis N-glycosyltransferase PgaC
MGAKCTCPPRYLVISPAKDEECYVQRTLESMIRQTIKPEAWIIVDDGSTDRTPQIVERYTSEFPFIRLMRGPRRGARQPGSGVIGAFDAGYEQARDLEYEFIVKLDCDLSFEADYFERLLTHFVEEPRLGIASGVYLESEDGNHWKEVVMPAYHAAGACKVVRRECFEEIGGFIHARGWDTVDEIRAMAKRWRTCHFPEVQLKHWKIEGSGIGAFRTSAMHGEIYYRTGGGRLFFLLKVLHRTASQPFVVGGLALLWGYLKTMSRRKPLFVTESEARFYRELLNSRITRKLKQTL